MDRSVSEVGVGRGEKRESRHILFLLRFLFHTFLLIFFIQYYFSMQSMMRCEKLRELLSGTIWGRRLREVMWLYSVILYRLQRRGFSSIHFAILSWCSRRCCLYLRSRSSHFDTLDRSAGHTPAGSGWLMTSSSYSNIPTFFSNRLASDEMLSSCYLSYFKIIIVVVRRLLPVLHTARCGFRGFEITFRLRGHHFVKALGFPGAWP